MATYNFPVGSIAMSDKGIVYKTGQFWCNTDYEWVWPKLYALLRFGYDNIVTADEVPEGSVITDNARIYTKVDGEFVDGLYTAKRGTLIMCGPLEDEEAPEVEMKIRWIFGTIPEGFSYLGTYEGDSFYGKYDSLSST